MCTITPDGAFYDLVYETAPKSEAYRMLIIFLKNNITSIEQFEKANIKDMLNFKGIGPKRQQIVRAMVGKLLDRRAKTWASFRC